MTKKHFEAVAATLNDQYRNVTDASARDLVITIASELSSTFKSANPRFDRGRFMDAVTNTK